MIGGSILQGAPAQPLSNRLLAALAIMLSCCAPGVAQGLSFTRDHEAATALARRARRPMMFYLLDRSRQGSSDLARRHAETFRDRRVSEAAALFVCVELSIDQHPELKRRWMLSRRVDRQVVFATPDGDKLHQSGVGDAGAFRSEIQRAFEAYGQREWEGDLRPAIQRPEASEAALVRALRRIRELNIRDADFDVMQLLERPTSVRELRGEVFATLAALSTRLAVRALVEFAAVDGDAAAALSMCTPVGAQSLAEWLGAGSAELDVAIAGAIAKTCDVASPKPDAFWRSAKDQTRRAEIHRLRRAARGAALRYQEELG